MDGKGEINLRDVVVESTSVDGRRLRQGFFLTQEAAQKFTDKARDRGLKVSEQEVPKEIVIESDYTVTVHFIASLHARKVAAKIALTAIALQYGAEFALSAQFDAVRAARVIDRPEDLPVRFFPNAGLMSAYIQTPYQHSVMCYLSAGMGKGWALVTLFGGISYLVSLTDNYSEKRKQAI